MGDLQDPIEDGGTDSVYVWPIFQAYFSVNITTIHMAKNMLLTYLHQLDPGDLPLISSWENPGDVPASHVFLYRGFKRCWKMVINNVAGMHIYIYI